MLVSGHKDVLNTLKNVLLPIGGLVTLMSLVIVLATAKDNIKLFFS